MLTPSVGCYFVDAVLVSTSAAPRRRACSSADTDDFDDAAVGAPPSRANGASRPTKYVSRHGTERLPAEERRRQLLSTALQLSAHGDDT